MTGWRATWVDYYELLEVIPTARVEVIEAAYKRLSLVHHPDRGGDAATMRTLNDARTTLVDVDLRRDYDVEHRRRVGADAASAARRAAEAEARAERAERAQRAAEERAGRARRSSPPGDGSRSAADPAAGDRERAIRDLRRDAERAVAAGAAERRRTHAEAEARRDGVVAAARRESASRQSGLLNRIKRGAMCGLQLHKGEWFYDDSSACAQRQVCTRCGRESSRIEHRWGDPQRILPAACEFATYCGRCGEEQVEWLHDWAWRYASTECQQVSACRHCELVDFDSVRPAHDWSPWTATGSEDRQRRTCARCGVSEERAVELGAPVATGADRTRARAGRGQSIAGRWVGPQGEFAIRGGASRVEIDGVAPNGVRLRGAGIVMGRRAIFDCANTLGGVGRLVVDVSADGSTLHGRWTDPTGVFPVDMVRR